MIRLYDSHCHLDAPEFDDDRPAVLQRARAAGVARQLVPAVSRAGWPKLKALAAARDDLRPAYGLHPMYPAALPPTSRPGHRGLRGGRRVWPGLLRRGPGAAGPAPVLPRPA